MELTLLDILVGANTTQISEVISPNYDPFVMNLLKKASRLKEYHEIGNFAKHLMSLSEQTYSTVSSNNRTTRNQYCDILSCLSCLDTSFLNKSKSSEFSGSICEHKNFALLLKATVSLYFSQVVHSFLIDLDDLNKIEGHLEINNGNKLAALIGDLFVTKGYWALGQIQDCFVFSCLTEGLEDSSRFVFKEPFSVETISKLIFVSKAYIAALHLGTQNLTVKHHKISMQASKYSSNEYCTFNQKNLMG